MAVENLVGTHGIIWNGRTKGWAPDARWADIPEVPGGEEHSEYTYRGFQNENRPVAFGSEDRNPRIHRSANEWSFLRQFDVFMGARNFDGGHMSMADHRRIMPPVYGMKTTSTTRNTYRLAPSPYDYSTLNYPTQGESQAPRQNSFTSPADNSMVINSSSSWRL